MKKIEYLKMFKLEDKHFWFVAKRYFISSLIYPYRKRINNILDMGSGTGGLTKYLQRYGKVTGIENNPFAVKLARSRGLKIKKGDLNNFLPKKNTYNLVTIFDVLYHRNINDESVILKNVNKSLKKGGLLLITDSALNFLKSYHDIATQGKRRYILRDLMHMVEKENFRILKASYIYFFTFPLVLVKRLLLDKINNKPESDVKPVPFLFNNLLLILLNIESWLLNFTSLPIGSSVIILAVKK